MGREVRRVPANWEHPRNGNGFVPHFYHFPYNEEEIQEGLQDGWLQNTPPNYGCDVMPNWPEAERTHYQMYESVTEGTPISPVMESAEVLAQWLADDVEWGTEGTYDQWLAVIKVGHAPSFYMKCGEIISGVAGTAKGL